MWSSQYQDYVKQLVETNRKEYPYYIAHTCTYWGSVNNYNKPSFKVYFSKEPITANDMYTYTLSGDSCVYSVIGGNANSNGSSRRVSFAPASGVISVDDYEFVYTNAEFTTASIQPDITASSSVSSSHFDGVSLILLVILLTAFVAKFLRGRI